MPTISKEKIPFKNKAGETVDFVRELKVTSYGTFSVDLPPDAVEVLNVKTAYGQSRAECLKNFNGFMADYASRSSIRKRIIAYKVNLDGEIERDGAPALSKWADYHDHYSKVEGLGLAIRVGVFDEVAVDQPNEHRKGKMTTVYRYEAVPSKLPKSVALTELAHRGDRETREWETKMPWSQEREDFWVRVSLGLERLILDLAGSFADRKKTLKLADGKATLLRLQ